MKYLFLILFFGLLAINNTAFAVSCQSAQGGYCVNLAAGSTQIPGFEFINATSPGDLISKLYLFGLSLAGISAFFMVTYGGVLYLTSRDNQTQIGKAKGYIGNALLGLVIALLSWLILYTINPNLVKNFSIGLPDIKYAPTPSTVDGNGILTEEDLKSAKKPDTFKGTDEQWKTVQGGAVVPSVAECGGKTVGGSIVGGLMRTCQAYKEKIASDPNTLNQINDLAKQRCAEVCVPLQ